tara:strand:- start:277 stop:423 length:147 start_codon:yes stop_codon:yes gene_type:complete
MKILSCIFIISITISCAKTDICHYPTTPKYNEKGEIIERAKGNNGYQE